MGKPNDIDATELARVLEATGGEVKQFIERQKSITDELRERVLELEQRAAQRNMRGLDDAPKDELSTLITKSAGLQSFLAGNTQSCTIIVPSNLLTKTQIVNATGQNQPLVPADRRPKIVHGPQQRMTVRGLFNVMPTSSNAIEYCVEASYTNNAAPQGGSTSPQGNGEGELKNESGMTFSLQNIPVRTLAHWIPASRQVLSDAPLLQGHLSNRLLYGLALIEETQMITGDGGAGTLTGLINQATAFNGGVTSQTALDTIAKAANQLAVGNYEPSGVILHPTDWLAMQLLKDTTGQYIIGSPKEGTMPQLWGLPVIPTASMTQGRFIVLDAARAGYIADRETANVRISESHDTHFVRNLIAILAELRVALVIEQGAAIIYGTISQ
jgi:HK97 family phage major capsid protein